MCLSNTFNFCAATTREAGTRREEDIIRVKGKNNKAGSTTDKQFSDEVTSLEITGRKPIPWIEWLVKDVDGGGVVHKFVHS